MARLIYYSLLKIKLPPLHIFRHSARGQKSTLFSREEKSESSMEGCTLRCMGFSLRYAVEATQPKTPQSKNQVKKPQTAEDILFESHHNLRPLHRDAKASKRAAQRQEWKRKYLIPNEHPNKRTHQS
jgi:hypothetical protein